MLLSQECLAPCAEEPRCLNVRAVGAVPTAQLLHKSMPRIDDFCCWSTTFCQAGILNEVWLFEVLGSLQWLKGL